MERLCWRYANELVGFFFAVTQILIVFVKMFKKSREENERQADAEKKKIEKEAMKERSSVKAKWNHMMFLVKGSARSASLVNWVEHPKRCRCEYQMCDFMDFHQGKLLSVLKNGIVGILKIWYVNFVLCF